MNKELKLLANNIIELIPSGEDGLEDVDTDLIVDEVVYNCEPVEELEISDQGKYQHGGTIYGVGVFNKEKGYGIIGETLFYIKQNYSRNGSYYTDYYYNYDKPYLVKQVDKVITTKVWEAIR